MLDYVEARDIDL